MQDRFDIDGVGRTLSARTVDTVHAVLDGRRSDWRSVLASVGPAVVAATAYVDPGNVATNIQAGARYGYTLIWVVLLANVVAMLFQALSARLGIMSGRNLAELCREYFPRPLVLVMWVLSEIAAMATDLAEFVGAAIGLSLAFGVSLFAGMIVAAIVVTAILAFDRYGFRPVELAVGALAVLLGLGYGAELLIAPVDWGEAARALIKPQIADRDALLLAVGIIGATIMPHAIYLHSGLTQSRIPSRSDDDRRHLVRLSDREVVAALSLAGIVNVAMVLMAAGAFHAGHPEVAEIETAYHTLTPLLGAAAAVVFLVSLVASGLSSSVVGTMAGQIIMQGFVGFSIPVWVRRAVTMVPAFVVIGLGAEPTRALVLSQVVLSLALPIPMLALLVFVRKREIMGALAIKPATLVIAAVATVFVLVLNGVLIATSLGVPLPGMAVQ